VLLDEPTDGLDPEQRSQLLALVARLGGELRLDIVLSSHLLHEVEQVCDSVVILDQGRTVASGRVNELRSGRGEEELVVQLRGGEPQAAALVERLHRLGVAAAVEGTGVVVALEGPVVYDLVRDALADAGASVHRMERRTVSLEDVFLRASA
jgi:ABC-2 type transport system ATP-binding protein